MAGMLPSLRSIHNQAIVAAVPESGTAKPNPIQSIWPQLTKRKILYAKRRVPVALETGLARRVGSVARCSRR